ncbi:MAG: hypothetical protein A2Y88_07250 [Chloroflexi bacterium RBG_13_48_10]|nr:MAG: hypothetical protein A2Y88_07250 [Chloroflexi bacterium RBG_13_48_10]
MAEARKEIKKMNGRKFEKQVIRDIDKAKMDLATLRDDGIIGLNRIFEQLTGDTQKTVDVAAKTINQTVGHGLSQFNAKVQDVADKVPGDLGKKALGYPWVTITLSLVVGLFLGALLKPRRPLLG